MIVSRKSLIEALVNASSPAEVEDALKQGGHEAVKLCGYRVLGYAWDRQSKNAPFAFSFQR